MDQFLSVVQDNAIWMVGALQLLVLLTLTILIHKINRMQYKTNRIIGKVENYLKVILEDDTDKEIDSPSRKMGDNNQSKMDEETQTRIISSVLQEIFP